MSLRRYNLAFELFYPLQHRRDVGLLDPSTEERLFEADYHGVERLLGDAQVRVRLAPWSRQGYLPGGETRKHLGF